MADDVAPTTVSFDEHFFDLERRRRFGIAALGIDLLLTPATGENLGSVLFEVTHPYAQDIPKLSLLQSRDAIFANHAPVGHDAYRADTEVRAQPLHE